MRDLLVVQGKGWTKQKEEDGQAGIILGRLANAVGEGLIYDPMPSKS